MRVDAERGGRRRVGGAGAVRGGTGVIARHEEIMREAQRERCTKESHIGALLPVFLKRAGASEKPVNEHLLESSQSGS